MLPKGCDPTYHTSALAFHCKHFFIWYLELSIYVELALTSGGDTHRP